MFDAFRIFIVIILGIFGLVVYPAIERSDDVVTIAEDYAKAATRDFVDIVRSKGYIEPSDYNLFVNKLSATNFTFEIEMEYYKKTYQPLYTNPNDYYSFTDEYETIFEGYYTNDILRVLFPSNTSVPPDDLSRRFNLYTGDLFNVRIYSEPSTIGASLKKMFSIKAKDIIAYQYGGMFSQ